MKYHTLSTRRLMIAMAIIAVPLGIYSNHLLARRLGFLEEAEYHARQESHERRNLAVFGRGGPTGFAAMAPSLINAQKSSLARVTFHSELGAKYRDAAARPWTSPDPDPKDPGEDLAWEGDKGDILLI